MLKVVVNNNNSTLFDPGADLVDTTISMAGMAIKDGCAVVVDLTIVIEDDDLNE